jgi:CubicO group peptidase (beta-lactamase class C family)
MKIMLNLLVLLAPVFTSAQTNTQLKKFAKDIDELRQALKIPGMSAAIVKDQKVIWADGLGYANLEQRIKATATTPYVIASLTKPVAATLLLQLMEQGKINLDDPIKKYFPRDFETDRVKLRHLITHTAGVFTPDGKPGDKYAYSGSWFGYLGFAIAKAADTSFRDQLVNQVLVPLNMNNSVPGHDVFSVMPSPIDHYTAGTRERYEAILQRLAKPYTLYGANENILSPYPPKNIGSSAGLISTVTDLAKFDAAIDQNQLIKKETQELAWTQAVTNSGEKIPYGLGWFVQEIGGLKLIWHYGQWPVFSGLYLKVPEKNITLILLANSTGLSAPFDMDKGDVANSPFALAFLKAFVIKDSSFTTQERKAKTAIDAYLQSRIERVRIEIDVDPAALDTLAGRYVLDNKQQVTVEKKEGHLAIEYPGQPMIDFFAESPAKFFSKIVNVQVVFSEGNELKLIQQGKEQKAIKVLKL